MTKSKAHKHCAFASFLLALATGATAFYMPPSIAFQNGVAAALLVASAYGHFKVQPWAYRLTQGVILLVLLGGFAALFTVGRFGVGVIPNIIVLWLIYANQMTREERIDESTPTSDSAPVGDPEG